MHQTFYIDIDEEITSIVEKLRKTEAPEAILVVPKRALLIQSIVNLKLLRKEANDLGLKISIVTQDKLGKMLVAKAGISIQQRLEENDNDAEKADIIDNKNGQKNKRGMEKTAKIELIGEANQTKRRLDKIGSPDYFASGNNDNNFNDKKIEEEKTIQEKTVQEKTVSSMDVSLPSRIKKPPIDFSRNNFSGETEKQKKYSYPSEQERPKAEDSRDRQVENFFYANNFAGKKGKEKEPEKKSGGFLKFLMIAGAIALVGGAAYGAYYFLPKAIITISAKKEIKSADLEITGNINLTGIDYEKMAIPAKEMDFEEEISKSFDATGTKNVSNKKAKGKITIYNEFSSAPQPLVATTRFLSDNQKLFRLVEGVTIPGTTKVGEEIKPGAVEAEVIADESSEDFNIDEPTKFTIPGFKNSGNEKYTKIYAKSLTAMTGGGNSNETAKVVSEKDINSAKDKISLEINSLIKKKIKDSVLDGTIILDDAIAIDEPLYRVSNSAGEITNNFEIRAQTKARALVFFEADMKKIANTAIIKTKGEGKINIDSGTVILDFGKPIVDFKMGTADIKLRASNIMQPEIDLEKLKKDILGKNNDELTEYMKNYPAMDKVEIEYWPPLFVNKIPLNGKRVEVILNAITP